jgi:hypothetical protein
VRDAVAELAAHHAPDLLGDLRGEAQGCEPAQVRVGGDVPGAQGGLVSGEETGAAPPLERSAPPTPVEIEFRSPGGGSSGKAAALTIGGVIVGGVAGTFVGAGKGLAQCGKTISGGGGAVVGVVFMVCAVVAAPVGAVVGAVVGTVQGGSMGHAIAERQASAARSDRLREASAAHGANVGSRIAAAVEASNEALAAAPETEEGPRVALGIARIVLFEEEGDPPESRLEMEVTIASADAPAGPVRRLCLRGPGAIPTELWLEREAALLRGAVEAQLARAVEHARAGLAPQRDDGPCPELIAKPASAIPPREAPEDEPLCRSDGSC